MFARVSTIQGTPEQAEGATEMFRAQVLPAVAEMGGKGGVLLLDRDNGKALSITVWESEEAMRESEERGNALRQQASEAVGATAPAGVERFEVVVWEV